MQEERKDENEERKGKELRLRVTCVASSDRQALAGLLAIFN